MEDVYTGLAVNVETRLNTSDMKLREQYPQGKKIEIMKYKLGGRIMKECTALRPNIYGYLSYLIDDDCVDKKTNGTKMCKIKCEFKININDSKRFSNA